MRKGLEMNFDLELTHKAVPAVVGLGACILLACAPIAALAHPVPSLSLAAQTAAASPLPPPGGPESGPGLRGPKMEPRPGPHEPGEMREARSSTSNSTSTSNSASCTSIAVAPVNVGGTQIGCEIVQR